MYMLETGGKKGGTVPFPPRKHPVHALPCSNGAKLSILNTSGSARDSTVSLKSACAAHALAVSGPIARQSDSTAGVPETVNRMSAVHTDCILHTPWRPWQRTSVEQCSARGRHE